MSEMAPAFSHLARNHAADSENRIHGEDARRYGFESGLVPGVAVYAWMTRAIVAEFGPEWLERGEASVRFGRPVYDGETVEIRSTREGGVLRVEVLAGEEKARALCTASLSAEGGDPPRVEEWPRAPLPAMESRPPARLTTLAPGTILGTRDLRLDLALAERTFVREAGDELPWYRPPARLHPGLLLGQANYILRDNRDLGPWIHVASEVRNFAAARDGSTFSLRGRVAEAYERDGSEIVVLDLAAFDEADRPLARIRHRAFVHLRDRLGERTDASA